MDRTRRIAAAMLMTASLTAAQTASPQAFDVASVKPNKSAEARNADMKVLPGGKVVIRNVPLLMIVAAAWDIPFQSPRLAGVNEFQSLLQERYDIDAAAPEGAIPAKLPSKERAALIRPMMQSLLKDRFHLTMQQQSRGQPVYVLKVAANGPKLEKAKTQEKDCDSLPDDQPKICHRIGGGQGRGIHGEAISFNDIALFVQNWTDRPVLDQTGLTDLYNIQTEGWAPMRFRPPNPDGAVAAGDAGVTDGDRQTLQDVFRQLGIAMVPERAVVEMYRIEHLERASAN